MSSSDQDSKLAYWLPKLESYRAAIDSDDSIQASSELPSFDTSESSLPNLDTTSCPELSELSVFEDAESIPASEMDDLPEPVSDVSILPMAVTRPTPQIVHLPIDGILKRVKSAKSFVLGIATMGEPESDLSRQIVADIVARCCDKTGRNAICVTIRPSGFLNTSDLGEPNENFHRVRWSYFGESKTETKAWHLQLAELPKWKKEFGLIVFDLGNLSSPMLPRMGRLCDGIVVQLLDSSNSRATIQALKSLQNDRLKILGAWSVELNSREMAA